MKTLRIFISSPSDVRPERVRAYDVVRRLQTKFRAFVEIEPVLWEHEAMRGTATFQAQIIPPSKTDVVVCILWARIGMRLPSQEYKRADGSVPTGTEWEFEDAYGAHQLQGVPDLLVYRKSAKPTITVESDQQLAEWQGQKRALDIFLDRWFKDHEGAFKAGFTAFESDDEFEALLSSHLEKIINERLQRDASEFDEEDHRITWFEGSPYRGLNVFQAEHAAIFCGRDLAVRNITGRLLNQASTGRVFLMLLGMSGCGKSSLARAGVLPELLRPGVVEGIECWRWAIFRPSEVSGTSTLIDGLATALATGPTALSELDSLGYDNAKLAAFLRDAPAHSIPLVQSALERAALRFAAAHQRSTPPIARFVLIVDQLEEIFTLERFDAAQRAAFVAAIAALSQSGLVWIITTMRSDLYGHCSADLLTLKGSDGQFDLTPPSFSEIGQMIRLPARAAGLHFEVHPKTHQRLDDALLDEAAESPEALPLLEFALDELYKEKSSTNALTWAAYESLGGLKGAIARRAEGVFARLSNDGRRAFVNVLGALIEFSKAETAVARRAPRNDLVCRPGVEEVLTAYTEANLFVTDRDQSGEPTVAFAHEALISTWPKVQAWIRENQDFLRLKARITEATRQWHQENRSAGFLLPRGKQLKFGRRLLRKHRRDLAPAEIVFIRRSSRRAFLRSWGGRVAILCFAAVVVVASAIGAFAAILSKSGVSPLSYVPIIELYVKGGLQRMLGNKSKALEAYRTGFERAIALQNVPISMRIFDVGMFDTVLELAMETGAPPPSDSAVERVYEWAAQYAQGEAIGGLSDDAVIGVCETVGRLLSQRGRWHDSAKYYDRRLVWLRKKAERKPADKDTKEKMCSTLVSAGRAKLRSDSVEEGRKNIEEALNIAHSLLASADRQNEAEALEQLSIVHFALGKSLTRSGDEHKAAAHFEATVKADRELLARHGNDITARRRELAIGLYNLGDSQIRGKEAVAGLKNLDEALAIVSSLPAPPDRKSEVDSLEQLSNIHFGLGQALTETRDYRGAIAHFEEAVTADRKLLGRDTDEPTFRRRELAICLLNCGESKLKAGDSPGAQAAVTEGITLERENLAASAELRDFENLNDLLKLVLDNGAPVPEGSTLELIYNSASKFAEEKHGRASESDKPVVTLSETTAKLLKSRRRWSEAAVYYDKCLLWLRKRAARDPDDQPARESICSVLIETGDTKIEARNFEGATSNLREALQITHSAPAPTEAKEEVRSLERLSRIHFLLGKGATRQARYIEALIDFQETVKYDRALLANHADDAIDRRQRLSASVRQVGIIEKALEKRAEARAAADESLALAREVFAASPDRKGMKENLVEALVEAGGINDPVTDPQKLQNGIIYYDEAITLDPKNVRAMSWRGYAYACLEKKEEAFADFNRALSIQPENREALRLLGWAHVILHSPAAALEPWAELRRVYEGPGEEATGGVLLAFAAAAWIRQVPAEAIVQYQKVVTTDPKWKDSRFVSTADWPDARKKLIEAMRRESFPAKSP